MLASSPGAAGVDATAGLDQNPQGMERDITAVVARMDQLLAELEGPGDRRQPFVAT
jgi:hypothetical protein